MNRNSTSFPLQITKHISNLIKNKQKDNKLKNHQYIIQQLIESYDINSRGLLVYHEMGLGKTITSIAAAFKYVKERQIIVLLSKSLRSNFLKNIYKLIDILDLDKDEYNQLVTDKFTFISSNASNMIKQIADNTSERDILNEKLHKINQINFDNKFLIIDEAHNIFRMITNGSKNALLLYGKIRTAKNLKLLFLTGTPISSDPFELVSCFNMLDLNSIPLFPENYVDFNNLFINLDNKKIKNKEMFMNRITGLVSYANIDEDMQKLFPIDLGIKIIKVQMSPIQYINYSIVKEKERISDQSSFKGPQKQNKLSVMVKSKGNSSSTYKVKSRQFSNFYFNDTEQNHQVTPKYQKVIDNIINSDGISLVYSQFAGLGGLKSLRYCLNQTNKFKYYFDDDKNEDNKKSYILIDGTVPSKIRDTAIDKLNDISNKNGNIIKIILISATGAEGLNLENVRYIHILEPYWNFGRIVQIKARGIRLGSHTNLPINERNVQTYVYLSISPNDDTEITTDEELYNRSLVSYIQMTSFTEMLKESSIDCEIYHKNNCYSCLPTDEQLYFPNILKDLNTTNKCCKPIMKKIKGKHFNFNNDKYYYTDNPDNKIIKFNIYKFNKMLEIYTKLQPNNIEHINITKLITIN